MTSRGTVGAMTTLEAAENEARQAVDGDPAPRLLERLVTQIGGRAGVDAVFGVPVERVGVTVIPVARVLWGVGGGGGAAVEGSGSGGGGGVIADPLGYIEVTSAGATFRPIARPFRGPIALLASAIAAGVVLRALAHLRR
jgi:uncharacterized spore protein YtfJ